MVDKEVLLWKNKAAEAERNRQALNNEIAKLKDNLGAARKALLEAQAIFKKLKQADIYDSMGYFQTDRVKFNKNEFIQAENMMRRAAAGIQPQMSIGEVPHKRKRIPDKPPVDPQTDNYYIDEEGNVHFFYLGRWHIGKEA